MKEYIKPSLREIQDYLILHVSTNNLCLDRSPGLIVKSITDLALTLKNESYGVSSSNIIVRNDHNYLNKKGWKMNAALLELCNKNQYILIDNSKKIKPRQINMRKLHLDQKGSFSFKNTFTK